MGKPSTATDSQDRGRFSARRKTEAVLRLLRGEDLDTLSRELGVTAATLSGWRESFLDGGTAAMKSRPADDRDEEIARLRSKVGQLTMDNELLGQKCQHLEATARTASERRSLPEPLRLPRRSNLRPYRDAARDLHRGMARSTAYYLKARDAVPPEQRPAPKKRGPVGAAAGRGLVGPCPQSWPRPVPRRGLSQGLGEG